MSSEEIQQFAQAFTAYGEASTVLSSLHTDLALLGLIRSASKSGILELAHRACSPNLLAHTLKLDESRIAALCCALDAFGVFVHEDGLYRLEDRWATLAAPGAPFSLEATVDYLLAQVYILEDVAAAPSYLSLPPQLRLALARGVTVNPASPFCPPMLRMTFQSISAELDARLMAGGRCLDLGCGIGGGLLSTLQAYPAMTAVGIDLAADLLAEARRQAEQLGVAARVEFVQVDARDFDQVAAFDLVHWPQLFFPAATRGAALQSAWQALKPGGFFVAPMTPDPPDSPTALHTDEGRTWALNNVLYGHWGIPLLGPEALRAEIQAAGFADVQATDTPAGRFVSARHA